MIKIRFEVDNGTQAPLFHQYPGQMFPQRAHLEFNPGRNAEAELELTADYNGEVGNAIPARVWDKSVFWFAIPANSSRASLEALAHDAVLEEMLQRLLKGDGGAELEIQNYLDTAALDTVSVWQAHEWVGQADIDLAELVNVGSIEALADQYLPCPHDGQVVLGDLAGAIARQIEWHLDLAGAEDWTETQRKAAKIVAAFRD